MIMGQHNRPQILDLQACPGQCGSKGSAGIGRTDAGIDQCPSLSSWKGIHIDIAQRKRNWDAEPQYILMDQVIHSSSIPYTMSLKCRERHCYSSLIKLNCSGSSCF